MSENKSVHLFFQNILCFTPCSQLSYHCSQFFFAGCCALYLWQLKVCFSFLVSSFPLRARDWMYIVGGGNSPATNLTWPFIVNFVRFPTVYHGKMSSIPALNLRRTASRLKSPQVNEELCFFFCISVPLTTASNFWWCVRWSRCTCVFIGIFSTVSPILVSSLNRQIAIWPEEENLLSAPSFQVSGAMVCISSDLTFFKYDRACANASKKLPPSPVSLWIGLQNGFH